LFHGELTVGLQPNIPLSRRVQLAVLAHIRHTHTRYDKLLRETSWINARKVVEPVCLDILVRWRGDEETGRDQLDEILREVVVITDSEGEDEDDDEDDSNSEEDGSDEEGEVTSESSPELLPQPNLHNQQKQLAHPKDRRPQSMVSQYSNGSNPGAQNAIASRTRSKIDPSNKEGRQRGNQRYRDAWAEAQERQAPAHQGNRSFENPTNRRTQSTVASPTYGVLQYPQNAPQSLYKNPDQSHFGRERHGDVPSARPVSAKLFASTTMGLWQSPSTVLMQIGFISLTA
jgi:hypothetical protein